MKVEKGDIFKSVSDGVEFTVKKVDRGWVILKSHDGTKQIMTGESTFNNQTFYEKKEDTEG